ncbi:MAG TPA: signal peptidase I [Candidatus Udaeobacter sp.]|nr:signal peptidase I [Candidatus Udaeobacter sp.]
MFTSRQAKHSRLLLRHARKYLRYKDDQLSSVDRDQITASMNDLREALRQRDRERIHSAAEALDKTLHSLTPVTWESHWRENCEVILVAIVVAVGIRSYFLQPFKIPTGSMQPTLNGIIGYPSTAPAPNILRQIGEFILLGRNYINVVSREDDQLLEIQPKKMFFFFTLSQLICQRQKYLVYAPPETLSHDFNLFPGRIFHRGEIIARGAIDTGDQVFVDKFSYNFVKPNRSDVFVFRTSHILGIPDPSQFYIKRLAGLPGDTLRIDPPFLYVNGKKAEGCGFARVMSMKPPYRGYAPGREYLSKPDRTFTVPWDGYFALGDNSYNSYDSRYWGAVPEANLVGRGLLVYWPFARHWGLIR